MLATAPLEVIPIYARAGGIVPMGPVQQYIGEKTLSTITLHIWAGASGKLQWHEDDGRPLAFDELEYYRREIAFGSGRRGYQLTFSKSQGSLQSEVKTWRIILHGLRKSFRAAVEGRPAPTRFDPQRAQLTFGVQNIAGAFEVRLD